MTEVLTNAYGDRYLPEINGDLFARQSAAELFANNTDPKLFREDCFHIVIGSDSGLLIDYVLKRGVPAGSTYLFVEPEPVNRKVTELCPMLAGNPHVALARPEDWLVVSEPLNMETYILKRQVLIHPCLATKRTANAIYQPLIDRIFLELDEAAYTVKAPYAGGSMIEMYLANVSENIVPINTLYSKFQGQTAIILGAGPSLDLHLDWIRKNREKLFVFAVSRLCRRLYKEQLIPDIVVSVDSQNINYERSNWLFKLPPRTLLVHSSHVSPRLVAQWHGKKCFIGNLLPWDSSLNSDNMQDEGGPTVSNSAMVLAGKMGFSTILLSGVDLCSPAGFTSHAGGAELKRKKEYVHEVSTYNGETAKTDINMVHAAKLMSDQAKNIYTAKVINLSEFACKVDGIKHTPCEEIPALTPTNTQWRNTLQPINQKSRIQHNNRILKHLQSVEKDLKKVRKLTNDAKTFNKKMYQKNKQGDFNLQAKRNLEKIKNHLDKDFSYLTIPIKKIAIDSFVIAMTTRDVFQLSSKELEQLGFRYYDAYEKGCTILQKLISDSIQRINSRIEEDSTHPNLSKIAKQWRADKQPLRSLLWKQQHPNSTALLNKENHELLKELEREANDTNDQDYFKVPNFIGPKPDQAWRIREHILNAYLNKEIIDLKKSLDHLQDPRIDNQRFKQLQSLILLCIELLRGGHEKALLYFDSAKSNDFSELLLLDTLAAALATQRNSVADNIFKQLSLINKQYLLEFANWLKLNNNILEAINAYTDYLQKKPEDTQTWLALATTYDDINELELANKVYQFILELDPKNRIARDRVSRSKNI